MTPSGTVDYYPAPEGFAPFDLSPDGRWVIWRPPNGIEIGAWGQVLHILAGGTHWGETVWLPDSSGMYFWTEKGLHYAEPPDFTPVLLSDVQRHDYAYWVMP